MPRFITIGYGDPADYARTARPVRDAAHAQDAKLRSEGAVIGIAGAPVQVRNPEAAGVQTLDGPPSCRPPCRSPDLPSSRAADLADSTSGRCRTCPARWRTASSKSGH